MKSQTISTFTVPPIVPAGMQNRRPAYGITAASRTLAAGMAITRTEFNGLMQLGVPFHVASRGVQDESVSAPAAQKRLQAGATVFLVQPHEYMPRIRRWIYQAGAALGFQYRPARSFLFRVDVPGKKAMPLHDDGDVESIWLQLSGARHVVFGPAHGKEIGTSPLPPLKANGRHDAWFEGSLEAGSCLYLPPYSPHWVLCRRPSIALSVYWEPVDAVAKAGEWLQFLRDETGELPIRKNWSPHKLAALLQRGAQKANGAAFREWQSLGLTSDGGCDVPPAPAESWVACKQITAWRAFEVITQLGEAVLAAGGEQLLTFPHEARPLLTALSGYGTVSLKQARNLLPDEARRVRLFELLHGAGLVTQGELPKVGLFEPRHLTGWTYSHDAHAE